MSQFKNKLAEDLFYGKRVRGFPPDVYRRERMRVQRVSAACELFDLIIPPSHQLKQLKGGSKGRHSIRINDQWHVCFRWTEQGAIDMEVIDYH